MALGWRGSYLRYREYFLNIASLYRRRADLRAFIEIILSASTITIFLLFALKPTALTIIALVSEINEKKVTIAGLDQKIADLEIAQNVYAQSESQIPNVNVSVANGPKPDAISKQVVGLSAKDSITLSGLSIGQVALIGKNTKVVKKPAGIKPFPEGAGEMSVTINMQGGYPNLLSFAKDLENLRVSTKIDSLQINSSETNGVKIMIAILSGRIPFLEK